MRNLFFFLVTVTASATTLEKLTVEQMAQKATSVVRGRVESCSSRFQGRNIYTFCRVRVSEQWKGTRQSVIEVAVPGGTTGGLTQTFSGAPSFTPNQEYVLFLWAGTSGVNQLIGLSQGALNVHFDAKGEELAQRDEIKASLLSADGQEVEDQAVELRVGELRKRIQSALKGATQ
jgi:hypothetical protein